jgi:hypothetical protein
MINRFVNTPIGLEGIVETACLLGLGAHYQDGYIELSPQHPYQESFRGLWNRDIFIRMFQMEPFLQFPEDGGFG